MEYIRLGSTGTKISRICLGCMSFGQRTEHWPWALDEEDSRPLIKRALERRCSVYPTHRG
jgi:aryl-alcohol dehydrogenase-like predicted oxidoreductase